ncbi:MAG: ABC transporter ATP-binding protein [Pirellulales bacterium]|nr:ABC transporter ATP-binding protein [Pirellulales bacterium]
MSTLIVENLEKEYPTRAEPLRVLCGVSLEVQPGQSLAVLGPSGSGKSTLLGIVGALDRPTRGRVLLDGEDPHALDERGTAAFRSRAVGFVFQEHYLLPQCSVLENVLIPLVAAGPIASEAVDRARMLLDRVGLSDRLDYRPAELSGGQRQRTALARALIHRPKLLLADEPTGDLDRASADRVGGLLRELQTEEQMLLLVVTHNERLAALLDRRMELADGKLNPL